MTESQRERIYGILALSLLALSPISFQHLREGSIVPTFATWQFVVVMAATIPGVILLEIPLGLLMRKNLRVRFWVKNPEIEVRAETKLPFDPARGEIERRLVRLGFRVSMNDDDVSFRKPKHEPTAGFLDNAFSGVSSLRKTGFGTEVATQLQMNDTIILETGESRALRALAGYITLEKDEFLLHEIPFTLYCGLLAALSSGALSLAAIRVDGLDPWITASSVSAAGLLAFSVHFVMKDRKRLFGFKLAGAGFLLAAVPWLAFLIP